MQGRRTTRTIVGVVATIALTAGVLTIQTGTALAACATADLKPVLRDVSINQGLGSYTPLVRGKQSLGVFYLSAPTCADNVTQAVEVVSASLTVTAGEKTTVIPAGDYSVPKTLVLHSQATRENGFAAAHTAHPAFVIPGDALAPAGVSAFVATFSANVTYNAVAYDAQGVKTVLETKTIPFSLLAGSAITAPVEKSTFAAKILAIPLGTRDTSINNTSPQFSTDATPDTVIDSASEAAVDGFNTMSRILPVQAGVGNLSDASKGLRATLDPGALLDVGSAFVADGKTKKFCGAGDRFSDFVQPRLHSFLLDYNTAQETTSGLPSIANAADRVMGVVDEVIAHSSSSCAEGWAGLGTPESWVKARYLSGSPKHTGAVMGMEFAHNLVAVPCSNDSSCPSTLDRDHNFDPAHSPVIFAHDPPAEFATSTASSWMRTYNVTTKRFLDTSTTYPEGRSVMQYGYQPAGWNNQSVLFRKADWDLVFCKHGGPVSPDCGLRPESGAGAGAGGDADNPPMIYGFSGSTDGQAAGTEVVNALSSRGPRSSEQSGSPLKVVQLAGGEELGRYSAPVSEGHSVHHDGSVNDAPRRWFFYGSFPLDARTERIRFLWSGEKIFEAVRNRAPEIAGLQVSIPGGSTPPEGTTIDFDEFDNHIGTTITDRYAEQGVTFVDQEGSTSRISGSCAGADLVDLIPELQQILESQETPPCRLGATQSHPFSLRNNQSLNQNTPLVMSFASPQKTVSMYVGNGDGDTNAMLEALGADGLPLPGVAASTSVGLNVTTPLQVDAAANVIHGVRLSYSDSQSEEIDGLFFSAELEPVAEVTTVVADVTDDTPLMKMTWFAECPDARQPQLSAADPDAPPVLGDDGLWHATFSFEPNLAQSCVGTNGLQISARVTDNFQTDFERAQPIAPPVVSSHPPEAVISTPDEQLRVLENEAVPLSGQGFDLDEGLLPDAAHTWTLTMDGLASPLTATGTVAHIAPPQGGWPVPPGADSAGGTATLEVVDSEGLSDTQTVQFTVLADDDGDGVPRAFEACAGANDSDPRDQRVDGDQDGRWNWADREPCIADPGVWTTVTSVDPTSINVPSVGGTFTVRMALPFEDENGVKSARIAEVDGFEVSGQKWQAWKVSVEQGLLTLKFDRQPLIDHFMQPRYSNALNRDYLVTFKGSGVSPAGNPYTFTTVGSVHVKKA